MNATAGRTSEHRPTDAPRECHHYVDVLALATRLGLAVVLVGSEVARFASCFFFFFFQAEDGIRDIRSTSPAHSPALRVDRPRGSPRRRVPRSRLRATWSRA